MSNNDIVQKLWGLCNILRDDGITYHQYLSELSYLLFLKMAEETGRDHELAEGYRWKDLTAKRGQAQFDFYREQLVMLGTHGTPQVRTIFANPTSLLRHADNLNALVDKLDSLDWFNAKKEGLGDLYEGLLQKNAAEKKSGAGQYFTPRALIESIVSLVKPQAGELIQDPAAGTGGFLVVASNFVHENSAKNSKAAKFQACELVQDTHRLLLMNAILHGMKGDFILGDSLSKEGAEQLTAADVILTNPPFGNKRGGGLPTRTDLLTLTSNKQLSFLQHVILRLKPRGRAAVVVPDNVLFEENAGYQVRSELFEKCDVHTILRLPDGIFYANVKTNVLFFTKGEKSSKGNTKGTWIYDMRTNVPVFGKRTPLEREHFAAFEEAFGTDVYGQSPRVHGAADDRFRFFTINQLLQRNLNLDISWKAQDQYNDDVSENTDPDEIVFEMRALLESALDELDALIEQSMPIDGGVIS
ncbi:MULTISPECIES: N-6 DNA methylase [Burkholderia]|uniref:site-specific DNA-methyltransferase (adenine-specific) n=1 Tax=Burkholderia sola TaxID=2843302 RepID=A0ABV2CF03_9BURK|nr:N-6 DNA methylase [Burkholderia sp. CpTa8-5]MBP0609745.1 N-6 DNA methylase [Burkholderia sp. CpTa8-5]